jgi:ABC-2 type transport system permease protein
VVAAQECRDLWLGGRGPSLLFGFSVLLSVVTYLTATNLAVNFLEQREAVNLVVQVAVAVGVLVALAVSADGISGERERGTLESLLLTPVSRRAILAGKAVAALSAWFAAFAVSVPYVWVLGRGVSLVGPALLLGLGVGTLLAAGLVGAGLLISALSNSNKVSLAVCFLLLLALFAPTQLPKLPQGWLGELLRRVNPVGAGLHYLTSVLVGGHDWTRDLSYLVAPSVTVVLAGGALFAFGARIVRLTGGVSGE